MNTIDTKYTIIIKNKITKYYIIFITQKCYKNSLKKICNS